MADLEIRLRSARPEYVYGESLALTYEVRNTSSRKLYVVTERAQKVVEGPTVLRVVVGHTKPEQPIAYYDFVAPVVAELPAGQVYSTALALAMPPQTVALSDGTLTYQDVPFSGAVEVYLAVGYGDAPVRPVTRDPLGEFLAWQRLAESNRVEIQVRSASVRP